MMIMQPMETDWRIIAMRSLPQFFDIVWACGPSSLKRYVGGVDMNKY
jgi:hypothetical protein